MTNHTGCIGEGCPICPLLEKPEYAGVRSYLTAPKQAPQPTNKHRPLVGSALQDLLQEFGATPTDGCGCGSMVKRMDEWGVGGCRQHRGEIEAHLREERRKTGWAKTVVVAFNMAKAGFVLDPVHPESGLLDEAIRRASQ